MRIIKALHEIRNETTIATMYRIGNLNNLVIARTNPTLFINIFSLRPECCVVLRSTKAQKTLRCHASRNGARTSKADILHRGSLQQLHYSVHTRRVITFISIMTGEQLNLHGKSHRSVTKFARGSVIVLPLRPTCNKASPSVLVHRWPDTRIEQVGWGVCVP